MDTRMRELSFDEQRNIRGGDWYYVLCLISESGSLIVGLL